VRTAECSYNIRRGGVVEGILQVLHVVVRKEEETVVEAKEKVEENVSGYGDPEGGCVEIRWVGVEDDS